MYLLCPAQMSQTFAVPGKYYRCRSFIVFSDPQGEPLGSAVVSTVPTLGFPLHMKMYDNATVSASVVEGATVLCFFDSHASGN